jgi:hypothetical protein
LPFAVGQRVRSALVLPAFRDHPGANGTVKEQIDDTYTVQWDDGTVEPGVTEDELAAAAASWGRRT